MTALRWLTSPDDVTPAMRQQLLACWRDVVNAGGAVGFPESTVDDAAVLPAVDAVVAALSPDEALLRVTDDDGALAGWLVLAGNPKPLFAHWATLQRVQTAPAARGTGVGTVLLTEAAARARARGLAHLHLTLRAGLGLEGFYARHGYREVGRWPAAIRLVDGELRDEVLMFLAL